jgi:hypothetical protein
MMTKLCCFLAFSGIGRQKIWSTSFHDSANSTLPAAPIARMPPSFLSTSSSVNFFLWGIEKLTPEYVLKAFVDVLVRLPPAALAGAVAAAAAPFCGPLFSSSLRFFVVGSTVGCDA